eukprot:CAMPEP_0198592272 /NCGR_PEP_ID=MMETSP1462-20131121/137911_1 /TAXON_ID=1333877 /ORGANISM="Brandtodinium nutriculum, Strain RCC3387" /LENGTH=124 /DNA_ID=CAMNT_0044323849 /DNA_START=46 /DNA_END=417 /DNA_ORIENTATION=-
MMDSMPAASGAWTNPPCPPRYSASRYAARSTRSHFAVSGGGPPSTAGVSSVQPLGIQPSNLGVAGPAETGGHGSSSPAAAQSSISLNISATAPSQSKLSMTSTRAPSAAPAASGGAASSPSPAA